MEIKKSLLSFLLTCSFFSGALSMKRVPAWTHERFVEERKKITKGQSGCTKPTTPSKVSNKKVFFVAWCSLLKKKGKK